MPVALSPIDMIMIEDQQETTEKQAQLAIENESRSHQRTLLSMYHAHHDT